MIKQLAISIRPQQWYKNLVLFIGIIFSENASNLDMWLEVIPAFFIFCALSSGGYLVNDILDIHKDQAHPVKHTRPIPSGKLSIRQALLSALFLLAAGLAGAYFVGNDFLFLSGLYVILTISYSLVLKRIIMIDLLAVSAGFVIRAAAGAAPIDVAIGTWAIACTFLLAFVLVLEKRRQELAQSEAMAQNLPAPSWTYNAKIVDWLTVLATVSLIITYSVYCILDASIPLILTIPLAVCGLIRYHLLVRIQNTRSEIEVVFKDKLIMLCMIAWLALIIVTFNDL